MIERGEISSAFMGTPWCFPHFYAWGNHKNMVSREAMQFFKMNEQIRKNIAVSGSCKNESKCGESPIFDTIFGVSECL